ncbi:MAG: DNA-binding transcriptional regulator [Verrucomicrobia bacterium]|nr:DNA-binding transcriptional regulator [Verrucomicrobiota bacterium]
MSERKAARRPNVTLIVETSLGSGRNILRGVARYAREHGPWLFHHEWRNTDLYYPPWLEDWEGDGIIARIENEEILLKLKSFNVPIVDVLGTMKDPDIPLVHVDDESIARLAADHLLERGFTRFGFCGLKGLNWSSRRAAAFKAAVESEGHSCSVLEWDSRKNTGWSWEKEVAAVLSWLRDLPKPVGIMLCNDQHAHLVLQACRGGGIAVPDEIALVGVDNDEPMCEVCDPPLSSVMPDDERVGYEAATLLDTLMRGNRRSAKPVYIQPSGVFTRLSTDVLAIEDSQVAQAVRFIREHACEDISIDDVVKQVPLSRSLLQRRFRKILERSLHDEIINVRLNHARFLLEEGDIPLALVAEKSGFKHQAYMGAVFRKRFGVTPLQHRRMHRPG